jgi:hypothetical protein
MAGSRSRTGICVALASLAYLAIALFVLRAVLPSPGTLLPYPALLDWESHPSMDLTLLDHRDQSMVVSVITRNAAILSSTPWELFSGFGQCHPMPRSYTLGEHMIGPSLLAALPYRVTHDPILSYNVALVLTLWIPALTMFALSFHFTRSPAAAFVAGLLFQLVPGRVVDPTHPYVHGDLWAPLLLLFLHRLFTAGRWRDALLFALFLSLEIVESLYPLLGCALLVLVYGGVLAIRNVRALPALLPKIAVASAIVLGVAWIVLGPYLHMRDTWRLLSGRTSIMMNVSDYGWGSIYFPGAMILGLAALGLVDRLRGARRVAGEDPRLALFAGGVVVLWCSTVGLPLPFTDRLLPSPIEMLKPLVPGLDAVRALNAIGLTANVAWAFLAGYGALLLVERRRAPVASAVAATVTALTVLFLYQGHFAKPMFSVWSFRLDAWRASPKAADVALLRRTARGAVLDVPFPLMETPAAANLAPHLLLNAYDPRATAACYNSFVSPVQLQVMEMTHRLPSAASADALAALGFGTVVLDKVRMDPRDLQTFLDGLRDLDASERIQPAGTTGRLMTYRLSSTAPVRSDYALLGSAESSPVAVRRGATDGSVRFEVEVANRGAATFRLPDPIAPEDLLVRWHDASGSVVQTDTVRALLPMALARGASFPVTLTTATPPTTGRYVVEVARAADPERVLASRMIDLQPGT